MITGAAARAFARVGRLPGYALPPLRPGFPARDCTCAPTRRTSAILSYRLSAISRRPEEAQSLIPSLLAESRRLTANSLRRIVPSHAP